VNTGSYESLRRVIASERRLWRRLGRGSGFCSGARFFRYQREHFLS